MFEVFLTIWWQNTDSVEIKLPVKNWEHMWLQVIFSVQKRGEMKRVHSDRLWESDPHILFISTRIWWIWDRSFQIEQLEYDIHLTHCGSESSHSFLSQVLISLGDAKGENLVRIISCTSMWDYEPLMLLSLLMFFGLGRGSWLSVVFTRRHPPHRALTVRKI